MSAKTQDDPPEFNHLAPKWFKDYMVELLDWMKDNRVLPGNFIETVPAPGQGTVINWKRPNSPVGLEAWETYISGVVAGGAATYSKIYVKVNPNSFCLKSLAWDDTLDVTQKDTEHEIRAEYAVWIAVRVDNTRSIISAVVKVGKPEDNDWDTYPDPVVWDDPDSPTRIQTYWMQLLAYVGEQDVTDPSNGKVLAFDSGNLTLFPVTQGMNLLVCDQCSRTDGAIVVTLIPYFAPKRL